MAERRVLQARQPVRQSHGMQRVRGRLDLRRAPDEDDVDAGEDDHRRSERARRRDATRELGDCSGGERDERDRRRLRQEPVSEPRDEPDADRERRPQRREERCRDAAEPREPLRAVGDDAQHGDADAERGRRRERPGRAAAVCGCATARHERRPRLCGAQHGVRRGKGQGPGVSGRFRMLSVA